jgi:hypothetical protein
VLLYFQALCGFSQTGRVWRFPTLPFRVDIPMIMFYSQGCAAEWLLYASERGKERQKAMLDRLGPSLKYLGAYFPSSSSYRARTVVQNAFLPRDPKVSRNAEHDFFTCLHPNAPRAMRQIPGSELIHHAFFLCHIARLA